MPSPKPTPPLPSRAFRQEVIYRTSPPGVGVRSAGFMLKPTARGAYRDRVQREYVAVYVLRGSGTFVDWTGAPHEVSAGCVIQLPPGRRHSVVQRPDGRWAECYVVLDGGFANHLARLGAIDVRRPLLRPGLDLGLVERFEQLLGDLAGAPDAAMPRTLARAHELVVAIHELDRRRREPDSHAGLIEHACARLAADPQRRVDVPALSAGLGLSYERFRKVFRAHVGMSPGEYRIRRRIDRARALIAQHRLSNKQVAYALGYRDPFTFSKQFKQVVGVSPEAFRRTV